MLINLDVDNRCPSSTVMFLNEKDIYLPIYSPGYPFQVYANNLNCAYSLRVKEGKKASFQIADFETELNHDTLTIYDGQPDWSSTANQLAK